MITLQSKLLRFDKKGEKTGWTYIAIPASVAEKLSPSNKKSFRVKGKIDGFEIQQVALIPMGDGDFIMPFNASMRKGTGKKDGDTIMVTLEPDHSELPISEDLLSCLSMEENCLERFLAMPKSHQHYYSKWIESGKSEATRSDRIMKTLFAMQHNMDYGAMIRHFKAIKS